MLDEGCLITCEVIDGDDSAVTLRAFCVRSTRVREVPHELQAKTRRDDFSIIWCCKLELSATCALHNAQCTALLTHIHK